MFITRSITSFIVLYLFLCISVRAQRIIKLYEKNGNPITDILVNTHTDEDMFYAEIGGTGSLRNFHNEEIFLWVFYTNMNWAELERKDERIWSSGSVTRFQSMASSGMVLEGKNNRQYETIARKINLAFKLTDINNAAVTIYLYAGKKQKKKNKDIMLYSELKPLVLKPELPELDSGDKADSKRGGIMVINELESMSPERRDSLMAVRIKKNINIYLKEAEKIYERALGTDSLPEIKECQNELKLLEVNFNQEVEDAKQSKQGSDPELNSDITAFKKILIAVDNREKNIIAEKERLNAEKLEAEKSAQEEKNPIWLIVGALGGITVLLSLFMTVFFKVLQKMQKKKDKEAKAQAIEAQKKAMREQQRLMEQASGNKNKRIKI